MGGYATMNKRERMFAAIEGRTPDHVPAVFSLHFPRECAFGQKAVDAHKDFYEKVDCDALKIMNEHLLPPIGKINSPDDWKRIKAFTRNDYVLADQIDLVKRILDTVKPEYSIATIHGVCASVIHPIEQTYGYVESRKVMCSTLRENKEVMLDAHKRATEIMCELARACVESGVDGIYYAALGGENHFYTDEEFEESIKPFDLEIMKAAKEAGAHVYLHICKEDLNMKRYKDYAPLSDVVNWGVYEAPMSLEEGRKLFPGCTIMGGLANRSGVIVQGDEQKITDEVQSIIKNFGENKFILGADCTLPTEIPYKSIAAAVKATVIK